MRRTYRWGLIGILLVGSGCASLQTAFERATFRRGQEIGPDARYDFGGFLPPGNWYRGNLHLHTTISDGDMDPTATVRLYRRAGYDFVALTDHIKGFLEEDKKTYRPLVYPLEQLNRCGILVLPGIEYDTKRDGETIHFVVVGPGYDQRLEEEEDLSRAASNWWDRGAFVFFAHPHWSLNATSVLEDLTFLPAVEVYNHSTAVSENARGDSRLHWDRLLRQSRRVLGLATDDVHEPPDDAFGGWVMVKARSLTADEIVKALRNGQFYFTTGPTLRDVFFDSEGRLRVRCSPVKVIRAISTVGKAKQAKARRGRSLREAVIEWDWKGGGKSLLPFVRVECVDRHGRTAWTQAVFPQDPSLR